MPYDVVTPNSILADVRPVAVVVNVTMPTVGIFVLVVAVGVNVQLPLPEPPLPVVPAGPVPPLALPPRPALPVVPAAPLPPRPALPVVPATPVPEPDAPVVPAGPPTPACPVVPAGAVGPGLPVVPACPVVPARPSSLPRRYRRCPGCRCQRRPWRRCRRRRPPAASKYSNTAGARRRFAWGIVLSYVYSVCASRDVPARRNSFAEVRGIPRASTRLPAEGKAPGQQ